LGVVPTRQFDGARSLQDSFVSGAIAIERPMPGMQMGQPGLVGYGPISFLLT
jgi:hypothetical protein